MSRTAHKLMASSGGKGYEIDQSLMLDKASASYLNRTPSSASNRRTWTYSGWVKKCTSSDSAYVIFSAHDAANENDASYGWIGIYGSKLYFGGGSTNWRITSRKFRDTSAWYHIVVAIDTTAGTAGDRVKIYINGVEETSFGTSNNPDQNEDLAINSTLEHRIGSIYYTNPNYWDGYMAEINFIDGSQLTPSSFGETDSDTGQWIPKEYKGSHGTNGFYKSFKKNDRYSVYFDGSTSASITTPDHTDFTFGTNNFTVEAWIYSYEDQGNTRYILSQGPTDGATASSSIAFNIDTNNKLRAYITYSGGYLDLISSTAIVENKWYHTALVRNSNTFSLYLDGTSVASTTSSITVHDSSSKMAVGQAGEYTTAHQFKGWISNVRIVNGTAVYTSNFTPSTSPLTAITNTKLLCCQDATATNENSGTSKTLTLTAANTYTQQMSPFSYDWYDDQSGQDNHYKAKNVTVNDVMLDSPTNNFPIFNYLDNGSNSTLSQGNLKTTMSGWSDVRATFQLPFTGKWYWELANTTDGNGYWGLWTTNYTDTDAGQDYGTGKQATSPGNLSGVSGYFSSAWSSGDIIAMAVDCDNGKLWWSKNGTWGGTNGNPATGANQGLTFTATDKWGIILAGASGFVANVNFGQNGTFAGTKLAQGNSDGGGVGNFYYTPPSGFKALCTKNLPTPAVENSSEHFNSVIYTGTGSTRSVTSAGHKPGMLWIKAYSTTDDHRIQDEVRGTTKQLDTNNTDAEYTAADGITSFDSDGFTIGADSSNQFNVSGTSYVAFSWKGAGSGSANNTGDINATVSANTTAGFSIVTFTANASNSDTIAHGLGVVPKVAIKRDRDSTGDWHIRTTSIDGSDDYLVLNSSAAASTFSSNYGSMTSQFVTNSASANGSSEVFYVFAEVEGFSQFGVYNGNAVVNGPFIHTGFTPKFFMAKHIGTGGEWWYQYDTARDEANPIPAMLFPNANSAQYTSGSNVIDIVSNGIKLRANNGTINGYSNNSNATYFYMAFAEFPLKYANAR